MTLALLWLTLNAAVLGFAYFRTRQRHQQPRDEYPQRPRRIRNREIRIVHGEQIDAHTR